MYIIHDMCLRKRSIRSWDAIRSLYTITWVIGVAPTVLLSLTAVLLASMKLVIFQVFSDVLEDRWIVLLSWVASLLTVPLAVLWVYFLVLQRKYDSGEGTATRLIVPASLVARVLFYVFHYFVLVLGMIMTVAYTAPIIYGCFILIEWVFVGEVPSVSDIRWSLAIAASVLSITGWALSAVVWGLVLDGKLSDGWKRKLIYIPFAPERNEDHLVELSAPEGESFCINDLV